MGAFRCAGLPVESGCLWSERGEREWERRWLQEWDRQSGDACESDRSFSPIGHTGIRWVESPRCCRHAKTGLSGECRCRSEPPGPKLASAHGTQRTGKRASQRCCNETQFYFSLQCVNKKETKKPYLNPGSVLPHQEAISIAATSQKLLKKDSEISVRAFSSSRVEGSRWFCCWCFPVEDDDAFPPAEVVVFTARLIFSEKKRSQPTVQQLAILKEWNKTKENARRLLAHRKNERIFFASSQIFLQFKFNSV